MLKVCDGFELRAGLAIILRGATCRIAMLREVLPDGCDGGHGRMFMLNIGETITCSQFPPTQSLNGAPAFAQEDEFSYFWGPILQG